MNGKLPRAEALRHGPIKSKAKGTKKGARGYTRKQKHKNREE